MQSEIKISPENLLLWGDLEDWSENGASAAPTEYTLGGSGATVAREATIVKKGSYSAALTRVGDNAKLYQDLAQYADYKGRKVTFGCWVYATVASRARIAIDDGFIDSYTKLLLHADGTDAATTFADSSQSAHTVTANGSAQVDTAQYKFGGASLSTPSNGSFLSVADHADFSFGAGDFTIDLWIRPSGLSASTQYLIAKQTFGGTGEFYLYIDSSNKLHFFADNGAGTTVNMVDSSALSDNTWYHVAVVRNGTAWNLYKDGTSVASATSSITIATVAVALRIGETVNSATTTFIGHMDEIRITKGLARWTTTFTPEVDSYANRSASSYHSGAAGWEYLTATHNMDSSATRLRIEMQVNTGNTTAYFDGAILCEGDTTFIILTDYADINEFTPSNTFRGQQFSIARRPGVRLPKMVPSSKSLNIKGKVLSNDRATTRSNWDTLNRILLSFRDKANGDQEMRDLYLFDDRFLRGHLSDLDQEHLASLKVYDFSWKFTMPEPFYQATTKTRNKQSLSSSPLTFTLIVGGNVFSRPVIKITAGGSNITTLTIENLTTGQYMSYVGTITAGNSLIVDTEALTVQNNGSDDLANLTGDSEMVFLPGDNQIRITSSATGGTSRIDWFDRWF